MKRPRVTKAHAWGLLETAANYLHGRTELDMWDAIQDCAGPYAAIDGVDAEVLADMAMNLHERKEP